MTEKKPKTIFQGEMLVGISAVFIGLSALAVSLYEACFCSVFNECWEASYTSFGSTRAVSECERSDQSFGE